MGPDCSPGCLFASFCICGFPPDFFSSSIWVPVQGPWHPPSPFSGCNHLHGLQSHSYRPSSLLRTYVPQFVSSDLFLFCQCNLCHNLCMESHLISSFMLILSEQLMRVPGPKCLVINELFLVYEKLTNNDHN